ncbi:MAG: hypothetical protein HY911_06340 [Desulfobacterales bacterium]|nr:hypothetical protein [Desulfobacterales bacterium]
MLPCLLPFPFPDGFSAKAGPAAHITKANNVRTKPNNPKIRFMPPPLFYPDLIACLRAKQEGAVAHIGAIVHGLIRFIKVFYARRPLPDRTPDGIGEADEPNCLDKG